MIVTILKKERECLLVKNKKYSKQLGHLTKEYHILHRLLDQERRKKIRLNSISEREETEALLYYKPSPLGNLSRKNRLSYIKRPSYYFKISSGTILQQRNKCKKDLIKKQRAKHVLFIKRKYIKYSRSGMIPKGCRVPTMISSYDSQFSEFCLLPFIECNSNQTQYYNGIEWIHELAEPNDSLREFVQDSSNDFIVKEKDLKIIKEKSINKINGALKKYTHCIKGEIETATTCVNKMVDTDGMKNTFDNNKDLHVNIIIQKYEKEEKIGTVRKTLIQQLTCFLWELFDICTTNRKEDFDVFSKQVYLFLKIHNMKRKQHISEAKSNEYMVQILYKLMSLCIGYIKELICDNQKRLNQLEIKINNIVVFSNDIIAQIKEKSNSQLRKIKPLKEILVTIQNIIMECEYP